MADLSTWTDRDYPVLLAAVAACQTSSFNQASCDEIAAAVGLPSEDVVKAVANLGERYLHITPAHSLVSADYIVRGATAAGLEAAEVWPSATALQERFIEALEKLIELTPAGSPKATKLEGVLAAVRDLATGTSSNVFGQLLIGALGG